MTATRTIAGHEFTLTVGRRHGASRPMASLGDERFTVTIRDIEGGGHDGPIVAEVPGLDYDAANTLLAAFNNGETSFAGRIWE